KLELNRFTETLNHYAGLGKAVRDTSIPGLDNERLGFVFRSPIGVVGAILPWNFPTTLLGNKIGPALLMGNTVVAKPAETTPITTFRVAQIMQNAGIPNGVLNVVTGPGAVLGRAIVEHPGIRKLSFTGSTLVGKEVLASSAAQLKRVTLELGGSDPLIICGDA